MDPVTNPYSPGAGTPPPYLAGRDDLQQSFETLIGRAAIGNAVQPMVLSGLRGVGKTVLLLRWRAMAIKAGWATAHLESRPGANLRAQLADATNDMLRQVSRKYRNQVRVERLKRVTASFARAAGATVTRGSFAFDVQPEPGVADSGSLETDLVELLVEVGEAAREEGSGAVILIDELQDVATEELAGLVGACHRISQAALPALIVGAGLPTVGRVLSEAKSTSRPMRSSSGTQRSKRRSGPRTWRWPPRGPLNSCVAPSSHRATTEQPRRNAGTCRRSGIWTMVRSQRSRWPQASDGVRPTCPSNVTAC